MDIIKPQNQQPSGSDEDLIYKTMPKGFAKPDLGSVKPLAQAPQPPQPAPQNPVQPLQPVQHPAPGPTEAHAAAPVPSGLMSDIGTGDRQKLIKKIVIIASAVIVIGLIAAGSFYYWKNKSQKSADTQAPNAMPAITPVSKIDPSWLAKYFKSAACGDQTICGDDADPDHDGLANVEEFQTKTDPNNPDSDGDGLADGDEVMIFSLDPLSTHSGNVPKYSDADDVKLKWNTAEHRAFLSTEIAQVGAKAKQYGFHQPSITTLGQDVTTFYLNSAEYPSPTPTDMDPAALDRDTQRSDVITKISFALLQYKQTNKAFPDTNDFSAMVQMIKPLLAGKAINTTDPKNVAPYVYTYAAVSKGADFKLTYFSETQNQAISLNAADAQKAYDLDQKNQRDTQRKADLEQISSALSLYSNDNADPSMPDEKVFPKQTDWKTVLVPKYISSIPSDPLTKRDYSYTVSIDQSSFAIQATLENPPTGKKGYLCTQDDCGLY